VPLAFFLILGFIAGGSSSSGNDGQSQIPGQVLQSEPSYPTDTSTYPTDTAAAGYGATSSTASDYYNSAAATTATSTVTPTASASASASVSASPTATGPAAVVIAAYADINRQDYQDAYNLGLAQNGESLQAFTAGYSTTKSDTITVTATSGDIVYVTLVALSTDGSQHTYQGTYTVYGAQITAANLQQVS
jgi:hypothetical protein